MARSPATISRVLQHLAGRLRRALALGLLCLTGQASALWAGDPVALLAATPAEITNLPGGARLMVWRIEDRAGAARPLDLVVVTVPGAAKTWRLLPVDASGSRADLLADLDCADAAVVTSGGFFAAREDGGLAPLGLAVGDGEELSPFAPRRWGGVLAREGADSAVVPLSAVPRSPAWDEALQSSPIVVADGRNDMLRDDGRLDNRLAIGLDGQGGLIAVGAFRAGGGAVSLHAMAELILALEDAAGVVVRDALALDGGSSAQILVPATGRSWGSPLPGYMPNALCVASAGR